MQTDVELVWFEGRDERWTRFGRPLVRRVIDERRRVLSFAPDAVFALVRRRENDQGLAHLRIDILRAVRPGEPFTAVQSVAPGGELLLHLAGWRKVGQALASIDAVEQTGVDPAAVSPDHWCHIQNRLTAGEAPRPYTRDHHRAWLLRRRSGG